MNYTKTIVCFANSRKIAGRCVAGKEWQDGKVGEWVRPVSNRPTHEISEEELRYQDGRDPQLLDIIEISCNEPQPLVYQRENHVIAPHHHWKCVGRFEWKNIQVWLDKPSNLWGLGKSSYSCLNNRLIIGQEDGASLYLIELECLHLLVGIKAPQYPDSRRAVRGEYMYQNTNYRMDVTDPVIERQYLGKADGQYDIANPVICVSLSDPHQAASNQPFYYYKLIAAVLYQERFR